MKSENWLHIIRISSFLTTCCSQATLFHTDTPAGRSEAFDSPVHAEFLQGRPDGGRGLLKIVVGDLGEEEVVRHVPVGDVVVGVVDAPPVLSVYGLHRRRREVEVRVIECLTTSAGTSADASK